MRAVYSSMLFLNFNRLPSFSTCFTMNHHVFSYAAIKGYEQFWRHLLRNKTDHIEGMLLFASFSGVRFGPGRLVFGSVHRDIYDIIFCQFFAARLSLY